MKGLTGNIGGMGRSQVNICRCQFHRLAGPPHRRIQTKVCNVLRSVAGRIQRGPYGAGGNGIDPDTVLYQLERKRSVEGDYGTFGGGIVDKGLFSLICSNRGCIDYCISAFHMRQREVWVIKRKKTVITCDKNNKGYSIRI